MPDNGQQFSLFGIADNLGVNSAVALQNPEDWNFGCAPSASALAPAAEIAFVQFYLASKSLID